MLAVGKFLGYVLSGLAMCLSLAALMAPLLAGPHAWWDGAWPLIGWTVSLTAAVVVHECGHLLACLALGVRVRGLRIGRPDRRAYRFQVRGVTVALGLPYAGQVEHAPVSSRWRAAVIAMAGSVANLVVAGALLAALAAGSAAGVHLSGTIRVPGRVAVEFSMAVLIGATGISNLLPFRAKWGRLSDGARLLMLGNGRLGRSLQQQEGAVKGPDGAIWRPATPQEAAEYQLDCAALGQLGGDQGARLPPEVADKWLAAFRDRTFIGLAAAWAVGRTLRKDGRYSELLELFEGYPAPHARLARTMWNSVGSLAYEVALVPGMPPHVLDLAAGRLQWLLDVHESPATHDDRAARAAALHSLAVTRLRQGKIQVVEDLCNAALAGPELSPANRATVLATIALARQALGQPCKKLLDEAAFLAPEADLVAEASSRSAATGI